MSWCILNAVKKTTRKQILTSDAFIPDVVHLCMRYEAKHGYFKQLARVIGNFKNMPKTLAGRHQHYMCYQMIDPTKYMKPQVSYTRGNLVQCCDPLESATCTCTICIG